MGSVDGVGGEQLVVYLESADVESALDGLVRSRDVTLVMRLIEGEFPNYQLLCVLSRTLGADTVVADRGWLAAHRRRISAFPDFLRPLYADTEVGIYALEVPRGRCRLG